MTCFNIPSIRDDSIGAIDIQATLERIEGNKEAFYRFREAVGAWVVRRVERVLGLVEQAKTDSESDELIENLQRTANKYQRSVDQFQADEDMYIPWGANGINGITVPKSHQDNNNNGRYRHLDEIMERIVDTA